MTLILYKPGEVLEIYKKGDTIGPSNKSWSLLFFPISEADFPDVSASLRTWMENKRKANNFTFFGDLATKPLSNITTIRSSFEQREHISSRTLTAFKLMLKEMGLCFGLKCENWPPENIESIIKQLPRDPENPRRILSVRQYLSGTVKPPGLK